MYYRRLPKFEYLAPGSIKEACSLLKGHKGEVRVMAGGTIVLHRMKERVAVQKYVMGLKSIKELDYIAFDKTAGLKIGAMATLQSVADSSVVKDRSEILSVVCRKLGTQHIRYMGTIGGNICTKFTTAETVPALIALEAEAKVINNAGEERKVLVENLYKEIKEGELLTEIRVPVMKEGSKGGYQKFAVRERYDYATVSAAVVMTFAKGVFKDRCEDIRLALGGVLLPDMRAKRAESMVKGQRITESIITQAAQAASEDGQTRSDLFFSAEYKKELINVMVKRAMSQALEGMKKEIAV